MSTTKSVIDLKNELALIRMDIRSGKQKDSNAHKKTKKKIAQLLTENTDKK